MLTYVNCPYCGQSNRIDIEKINQRFEVACGCGETFGVYITLQVQTWRMEENKQ